MEDTRERLIAEWIPHREAYRLYRPGSWKETVAYVEDLNEVDKSRFAVTIIADKEGEGSCS